MLISHICKFIYLKTVKTAGTSVEIYFEPYCVDPRQYWGEEHARQGVESDWGVVGGRRQFSSPDTWHNHMPAGAVRERLGLTRWSQYLKFCVIRNPYDKVVSYFWHDLAEPTRDRLRDADFGTVRRQFTDWMKLGRLPVDTPIYTLDGVSAADEFIRYECLAADMERICGRLDIPWQPTRLGRYKSESRKRSEAYDEYFTPETMACVEQAFSWEFEHLGYHRLPGAAAP